MTADAALRRFCRHFAKVCIDDSFFSWLFVFDPGSGLPAYADKNDITIEQFRRPVRAPT